MNTGYCELDDGAVYFEDSATPGKPVLLLNHAAFLDSRMWDAQFAVFAKDYRVIRHDMRGFGKSARANGPRSRREDVYALLSHLGVTRAHVLGCSMGGEIGLDMALERPALVASLTMVNSPPSGFELQGPPPRYILEMIAATQRGDYERASDLQLRIWVDGPHREPEQVDTAVRARASEMNRIFVRNNTFVVADVQPLNPLQPAAVTRLGHVRCPVLLITGGLDDSEILRAAAVLAADIPDVARVDIPDTAHVPNLEAPEKFNRAVLAFLSRRG